MLNTKITEVLKTFSNEELSDFEKFIKSPYFKNGRDYLPLFKILKAYHPRFEFPQPAKQFVYSKLCPGSNYNDQVMRNSLSGLMKLCEKFLVLTRINESPLEFHRTLADEYSRRMLNKLSLRNVEKCFALLDETGIDAEYFKQQYELQQIRQNIYGSSNDSTGAIQSLSLGGINFIYYFILQLNRQIEEMAVFNHNLNADFVNHITFKLAEYLDLEKVKNFLTEKSYKNSEIAELFIANIKLLIDYKNEEYFTKFRELLTNNFSRLSRWGQYNMYLCLENACVRLQTVNETKYRAAQLEIYKEQLERGVYNSAEGGPIAPDMFRNIVINALRLEEYEWVEEFISTYIKNLQPEYRDNMYNFSMSLLSFEKGRFEHSLSFISNVRFDSIVLKFDVKILTLMVYFELGYFEAAISMMDSFRHFILETPYISGYIKEIHTNFIKYLNELIKMKVTDKHYDKQLFINEVSTVKVRNKEWLIEKALSIK